MEYSIKHVLADGREVDSIAGYVIPCTGSTIAVYHIVAEMIEKRKKGEKTNAST